MSTMTALYLSGIELELNINKLNRAHRLCGDMLGCFYIVCFSFVLILMRIAKILVFAFLFCGNNVVIYRLATGYKRRFRFGEGGFDFFQGGFGCRLVHIFPVKYVYKFG